MFDVRMAGLEDGPLWSALLSNGLGADILWSLCLAAMAALSLRAWRRMHPTAWAPLQWDRHGQPVMRAQRDLAVAFTPLAAAVGGLLLAAAERLSGQVEPGWLAVRLLAPLLLLAAHRSHLRHAMKTLKVEGGLKA
ncbi:MAG TPA: hypothetical protein VMU59_11750 [Caulobacteraceae bacterium]|nr:hypothetical protein [Caulobacteraceae bacterium]